MPTFNDPQMDPFENIVGKGENAGNQHFLLFPTMFSTLQEAGLIIPVMPFTSVYIIYKMLSIKRNFHFFLFG